MRAVSVHVTGVVQGVGFRPFVYTLARDLRVRGWVKNTSDGVFSHAEGDDDAVTAFVRRIRDDAPPMAVVKAVAAADVAVEDHTDFVIIESEAIAGAMTLVSPDIATCDACKSELRDPDDRRFGYPFTNCTNCGPRFTIIEDVPYDRPLTTMRDFPLCDECAAEYRDPGDRRFHAQPNACFRCGPRLYLNVLDRDRPGEGPALRQSSPEALGALGRSSAPSTPPPAAELAADPLPAGPPTDIEWNPLADQTPRPHRDIDAERERATAIIAETASLLRDGAIVAVKGLGGFQLACDAANDDAVLRLRERKHRWGKALAVMVPSLETARGYCEISPDEEALLTAPSAPIVLLRLREASVQSGGSAASSVAGGAAGAREERASAARAPGKDCLSAGPPTPPLAPSLAPGLSDLGVMLPYTPLHHLLLDAFGGPLVMTSGNRSDEPIATGNAEALERLTDIADAFLMHDRDIYSRYDDSVVRHTPDVGVEFIRRARGYAPFPLSSPIVEGVDILAAGPEQKNTFCLLTGEHAFVSQHIGDMENAETLESYERTIALYERLFRVRPEAVAYDLHPEYLSTKHALALGLRVTGVQHHHAHIASVTAEHGIAERVLGVALDGTGYGVDGTIWGGEWLAADWTGFERVAHLRTLPLPGGAAAIRRPARMALGSLAGCGLLEHPGAAHLRARLAEGEEKTVLAMIEHRLNTPHTSSMGRLFDAIAALAGVRDDALYEGQAAIELEAVADPVAEGSYAFGIFDGDGALVVDSAPVLEAVLDDVAADVGAPEISTRFHRAVVSAVVDVCVRLAPELGVRHVALSGGVFMNRLVLRGAMLGLREAGLEPLTHLRLPANDGGVSFGQAVIARALLAER
ncbi:MAG: carbamoyltransferase HypF [Coriobacteriia bacterium]|nr:carbamoyltransferase HypF [Coriobacteriia bacterium]